MKNKIAIREVWSDNLEYEFSVIREVVETYNHISMDTEFPGVVVKSDGFSTRKPSEHYSVLKLNVDALNLIQVGLTLSDSRGNLPTDGKASYIWEFNFKDFDLDRDRHAPDSIDLLARQGIDFGKNKEKGIDSARFAELMMTSGLVCNNAVSWVTFHSAYDFGYLVKILTRVELPSELDGFLRVVKVFFGDEIYDLKHVMRFCNSLYGGLDRVAMSVGVDRVIGKCHQAGSDSLLTWHAFLKIRDSFFVDGGFRKHAGVLYGLEEGVVIN